MSFNVVPYRFSTLLEFDGIVVSVAIAPSGDRVVINVDGGGHSAGCLTEIEFEQGHGHFEGLRRQLQENVVDRPFSSFGTSHARSHVVYYSHLNDALQSRPSLSCPCMAAQWMECLPWLNVQLCSYQ